MVSDVKARGGNYFLYEFRVEEACRDTELDTMMASARSPTIAQTTPPTNTLMAGRWERKYIEMSRIGAPRRRTVVPPSHHSIHSLAGRRFQGCMPKKMTAHNMVTLPDATIRPLPDSGGACQLSHGSLCVSVDKISINVKSPVTRLTGSANMGSPLRGPDWVWLTSESAIFGSILMLFVSSFKFIVQFQGVSNKGAHGHKNARGCAANNSPVPKIWI